MGRCAIELASGETGDMWVPLHDKAGHQLSDKGGKMSSVRVRAVYQKASPTEGDDAGFWA